MTDFYTSFRSVLSNDMVQNNFSGLVRKNTVHNITREEWHGVYEKQIMHIYDILADLLDSRYNHKIDWVKNDKVLIQLSKLLYSKSSKYVSPFM